MILESQLLIVLVGAVVLAMAALVVYVRLKVMREPVELPLQRTPKKPAGSAVKGAAKPAAAAAKPKAGGIKGLLQKRPSPKPEKKPKKPTEKSKPRKPGTTDQLVAVFSMARGLRKKKEQAQEQSAVIDQEIDRVLKGAEEITIVNNDGIPDIGLASEADGLKKAAAAPEPPLEPKIALPQFGLLDDSLKPEGNPNDVSVVENGLSAGLGGGLAQQTNLDPGARADPLKALDEQKKAGGKKEEEALKKDDPFAPKDSTDNLMDEISAVTEKKEELDMSIMKEFRNMNITTSDLEGDLKGILDKVTINAGAGKKRKHKT